MLLAIRLKIALVPFFFFIGCKEKQTVNEKNAVKELPNIVLMVSDDHGYQAVGAYGSSLLRTPHIDSIAARSVLFEKAFVNNSICGPSRAAILTGTYSHVNGFRNNGDTFDGSQATLAKLLQAKGYATAMVGKWHLKSEPTGFDYWNVLPGQGDYYNPDFIEMGKDTAYHGYVTDVTADIALDWLSGHLPQATGKPFFLMLNQKAPHRNWMPSLDDLEEFDDRTFDPPSNFFENATTEALKRAEITIEGLMDPSYDLKVPPGPVRSEPFTDEGAQWLQKVLSRMDAEQRKRWEDAYAEEARAVDLGKMDAEDLLRWKFQRYLEDYLRCVRSVDDNVGRILRYLEKEGLEENTIVIYTSDQGFFLGEHGLFDKRFMYEESFRTPMVLSYPKEIPRGQKRDEMVMNIDLAPTLLDFAEAEVPPRMQGRSFRTMISGDGHPDESSDRTSDWRNEVYYHYYERSFGMAEHCGIRTDRFKLIYFYAPVDAWELYDLHTDPKEMENLAGDADYAQVFSDLKLRLRNKKAELGEGPLPQGK